MTLGWMQSASAAFKWSRPEVVANGVTMSRCDVEDPNKMRILAVRIDTKTPGLYFTGTGAAPAPDFGKPMPEAKTLSVGEKPCEFTDICMVKETTRSFFERCAKPADQGGRGLDMIVAFTSIASRPPHSGDFLNPHGLVISDGKVVADHPKGRMPMFVVRRNGNVELAETVVPAEYDDIVVAHTLRSFIRRAGKDVVPPERLERYARLSIGLTADKRYIYIVSVDNGEAVKRDTGAHNHEINDIFADLGCPDAASIDVGSTWSVVVRDRKTGPRIINRMDVGADPGKSFGCIGVYFADPKVAAAGQKGGGQPVVPTVVPRGLEPEVSVRFVQTHLSTAREKVGNRMETVMKGQVRLTVASEQPRFKRPSLNIVALFDIEGMWQYAGVLVLDQKTSHGVNLNREQTPQGISKHQPEVTGSSWTQTVFGDHKSAFFKTYGISAEKAKLMAYRLEFWQNGALVTSYDVEKSPLKRLGVPEDWYIKGKHPGKISYIWPPPPAKK